MAWWQIWRKVGGGEAESNAGVQSAGSAESVAPSSMDSGQLDSGSASGSPLGGVGTSGEGRIHRVADTESEPTGVSGEPQGWRLLAPPRLLSATPMPTTFNSSLQRTLAAHIPTGQLAATSRPLGHDLRADGPIGTVKSVMRTVSSSAADVLPATLASGTDLILRRKILPPEEAAVFGGPLAARFGAGASARSLSSVDVAQRSASITEAPTVHRSFEAADLGPMGGSMVDPIGTNPDSSMARVAEPTPLPGAVAGSGSGLSSDVGGLSSMIGGPSSSGSALPIFRKVAPIIGESDPISALTFTKAPALEVPKEQSRLLASEAPLVPLGSTGSTGSGGTSFVSRSAEESEGSGSLTPTVPTRQRRFVEVRQGEPVSLASFSSPVASVQDSAPVGVASPLGEPTAASGFSSTSDSSPSLIARSADPDLPRTPDGFSGSVNESTAPAVVPTLGRRAGLGMPMNELPATAILRVPEADPFAGWNDDNDSGSDLPLVGAGAFESSASADTGAGPTIARLADEGSQHSLGQPGLQAVVSGEVDNAVSAYPSTSLGRDAGGAIGADNQPVSGVSGRTSDSATADGGRSSVTLRTVASHAPLIGQRAFDMSIREAMDPLTLPAGSAASVAPVSLQWGTDSRPAASQRASERGESIPPSASRAVNRSAADGPNPSNGGGRSSSSGGFGSGSGSASNSGSGVGAGPGVSGGSLTTSGAVRRTSDDTGAGPGSVLSDGVTVGGATGSSDGQPVPVLSGRSGSTGWPAVNSAATTANEPSVSLLRTADAARGEAVTMRPWPSGGEGAPGVNLSIGGGWSAAEANVVRHSGRTVNRSMSSSSGSSVGSATPATSTTSAAVPLAPMGGTLPAVQRSWSFEQSVGGPSSGTAGSVSVQPGTDGSTLLPVERSFDGAEGSPIRSLPLAGLPPAPASGGQFSSVTNRSTDSTARPGGIQSSPVMELSSSWSPTESASSATPSASDDGQFGNSFIARAIDTNGEAAAAGGAESGGGAGGEAASAGGGSTAQSEAELEQLAGKLYERIRQRLRRELLDDRERSGFALDRMR